MENKILNADPLGTYASNNFVSAEAQGAISSRTILIGHMPDPKNPSVVNVIGGITDGSVSINKNVISIQELGSDETLIVAGRTTPFSMQLSKSYINGNSLLKSIMSKEELKEAFPTGEAPEFIMNIATKVLKKPRTFVLFMIADGDSAPPKFISLAVGTMIQSYSMSINSDQEVIFENMALTGSFFKKGGGK